MDCARSRSLQDDTGVLGVVYHGWYQQWRPKGAAARMFKCPYCSCQHKPAFALTLAGLCFCCSCPLSAQAVSSIPQSTLQALLPVLSGIDPAKLTAQLKLLGQQDKETLDKMVFFLKSVSILLLAVFVFGCTVIKPVWLELQGKLHPSLAPLTISAMTTCSLCAEAHDCVTLRPNHGVEANLDSLVP